MNYGVQDSKGTAYRHLSFLATLFGSDNNEVWVMPDLCSFVKAYVVFLLVSLILP